MGGKETQGSASEKSSANENSQVNPEENEQLASRGQGSSSSVGWIIYFHFQHTPLS